MFNKNLAFTLVEVVITIVIVIVLASISVPIYKKHTLDAKLSEGYVLLAAVRDAEFLYYSEYKNFLSGYSTCNSEILNIDARGNKYFTLFSIYGSGSTYLQLNVQAANLKTLWLRHNKTTGTTFI